MSELTENRDQWTDARLETWKRREQERKRAEEPMCFSTLCSKVEAACKQIGLPKVIRAHTASWPWIYLEDSLCTDATPDKTRDIVYIEHITPFDGRSYYARSSVIINEWVFDRETFSRFYGALKCLGIEPRTVRETSSTVFPRREDVDAWRDRTPRYTTSTVPVRKAA